MYLKRIIFVAIAATLMSSVPAIAGSAFVPEDQKSGRCSNASQLSGGCPPPTTKIADGAVQLGASTTTPGTGGTGTRTTPGIGIGTGTGTGQGEPPLTHEQWQAREDERRAYAEAHGLIYRAPFWGATTGDPTDPTTGPVAPVTLTDIATFHPDPGTTLMQPDGWTITHLPTNIHNTTTTHTVTGTLLGHPATVRFTPTAWHWDYGDGTTTTTTTGGHPWTTPDEEFTPTPTTHTYDQTGNYTITLTIDYTAAYTYTTTDYIAIAGILPVTTTPLTGTAKNATTVLVTADCTTTPTAPGC